LATIVLFVLTNILISAGISFLLFRRKRWYWQLIAFSLTTLVSQHVVVETGISNQVGTFNFRGEVYDLETLTIMYYLVGIIPLIVLLALGVGGQIVQIFRKRTPLSR
jgi:hypothetical protein